MHPTAPRTIGQTGITLSPLVFGGNVFGWTADKAASFAMLDRLLDAGLTSIDTADVYSRWVPGNQGGESETILGEWMQSRGARDRIQLITKVGMDMGAAGQGLSAAHIERAVEASLTRLRTDRIDVYFSHRFDDGVPQAETLGAFDRLVRAGRCAPSAPATSRRRRCAKRWTWPPRRACRATPCCSPNTTCSTVPASTARCAIWRWPRGWP